MNRMKKKEKLETGSESWRGLIKKGAAHFNVIVDEKTTRLFAIHAGELIRWNKKINLTAILNPLEIAVKHFVDSIALAPMLPEQARVLDIGSGGGFPGLPLKAARPDLSIIMIDASRKKINFLKHVIRETGFEDIEAIHGRAEDIAGNLLRGKTFDAVVCRAFASLENFVLKGAPFVSQNGVLIALKGKAGEDEAGKFLSNQVKNPDLRNSEEKFNIMVKKYRLPFLDLERSLIRVKKRLK